MGRTYFYSVNRVFVFCQNKEFGCDWQGVYGDCAEHLAKSCFAVQPEQLLKRLEASEKYADTRTAQLAASRVAVDELKKENAKLKEEVGAATKQARGRLVEKYVLEVELAVIKGDLDARTSLARDLEAHVAALKENGSHMVIDLKKLEDENSFLRERNHAQLRDRNRLIWNLQEKLKLALRKRGRDDDSSRSSRARTPKRRRHGSAGSQMMSRRSSPHSQPSRPIDVDVDEGKPAWERAGVSPLLSWTTGKGQCFY